MCLFFLIHFGVSETTQGEDFFFVKLSTPQKVGVFVVSVPWINQDYRVLKGPGVSKGKG